VFDLFAQSDRTLDRPQGGLGIGLAVVKRLVEMHGGEVSARSEGVGLGATFRIRLPRIAPPQPISRLVEGENLPRRRVLVVDDNVDAADSLALLLTMQGHEVEAVYSAQQALERVQSFEPEAALLDIGLPEMTGYELAARIRALPTGSSTLLVAHTGYGQAEDRQRSQASGFDEHLVTPVDLGSLERVIARERA
jgi:CheY-like chemotaxis protein